MTSDILKTESYYDWPLAHSMSRPNFFLTVFVATQAYNLVVTGGCHFVKKTRTPCFY